MYISAQALDIFYDTIMEEISWENVREKGDSKSKKSLSIEIVTWSGNGENVYTINSSSTRLPTTGIMYYPDTCTKL